MTFRTLLGGLAVALALPFGAAAGPITNGGFETGDFTGFDTIGATSIVGDDFGAEIPGGDFAALASALSVTDGDAEADAVATFLGLDVAAFGNQATQGSAISAQITGAAGEAVFFSFNFLTNEGASSEFNDFGFVSLVGEGLAGIGLLADTFSVLGDSLSDFGDETGTITGFVTLPVAGSFTLGFGAFNVIDTDVSSSLLVDDISIDVVGAGGPGATEIALADVIPGTVVPVPAPLALMGLGLAGLVVARRRR